MPLQPKPRPGERCELCAELIPDEHGHVVDLESRSADVRLPALLPACSRRRAPAAAASGPCPSGTCRSPSFTLSPRPSGTRLQIPVGVAFFFINSVARPRRRVLPEPGRRHRVAAARWTRGTRSSPPTRSWPRSQPDVEAFLVRSAERRVRSRPQASATWCRSTSATSWSASCAGCGGASTAGTEAHAALDAFFDRIAQGRAGASRRRSAPMSPVSFEVRRGPGRAVRRGADAGAAPADHRAADGAAGARHRAALPDHDRAAAPSLRRRGGARLARAVRRDAAMGRHAAAVPVDERRPRWSPASPARPRSTCRSPARYDFEVAAAQVHALARRRRDPASC